MTRLCSPDVVGHFETDDGHESMWTSDPAVNQAMSMQLWLYFSPAK